MLKQGWSVIGVSGVVMVTIIDKVLATCPLAAVKVSSPSTNNTPKQLFCVSLREAVEP